MLRRLILKYVHWTVGVRSPAEAKYFSSNLCEQTTSEAHPAFYQMGCGGPFPEVKHGRGATLTTHPIYCRGKNEWELYSSPPWRLYGGSGTALLLLYILDT
jgi:hypothetical protein